MLRPTNQFEALMKDTRFAQQFPIDNEDAIETYVTVDPLPYLPIFMFWWEQNTPVIVLVHGCVLASFPGLCVSLGTRLCVCVFEHVY